MLIGADERLRGLRSDLIDSSIGEPKPMTTYQCFHSV
jgi:hypothetical protein